MNIKLTYKNGKFYCRAKGKNHKVTSLKELSKQCGIKHYG